ncbi:MAG: phosphonate ABC transporter substrate-binding protein [Calditrichaeota bacterium]|nr:MAG: phosphonate ABC transporter substrate-binding protein [Calditrichota bacterium]MBL1207653.1 phosphonate ABC transporter substrate-binding protein [Calditrichota bacterium]NOG47486.1 PhnD/SsuA/transferrin family substrate-binding protein [Calditrichota bacterium]
MKLTILWIVFLAILNGFSQTNLTFGIYASDKPTEMIKQFRPVMKVLENGLSEYLGKPIKIKIHVAKSYTQGIDDLITGKVDFSRFGPASYVKAKDQNDKLRIITLESIKGKNTFYGIFCTQENSPIKSVKDLKGKKFAFGNKNSTIGRYLAQQHMIDNNVMSSDLLEYKYLGRHDLVGTEVAAGNFDAGSLKESTFKKLVKKGLSLREIARFENVTKPWIASGNMDEKIYLAIQNVLLELKDAKALKALKKDGFVKGSDSDFQKIRESIKRNAEFFK